VLVTELIRFLNINRCKSSVIPITHLPQIESSINDLSLSGAIKDDFYPEITRHYDFNYKNTFPHASSIIITASPQPPTRVFFGGHAVIIPPTYIYSDIQQAQLKLVMDFLDPLGYGVARARLPLKALAVRSRLGKYGRNHICYIPGMGSFFRLGAFYSDLPCKEDGWNEPELMKSCLSCKACAEKCPTNCISSEGFVIRADRCLTHFNESESTLPGWIDPAWHNSLLGCMICQEVCPMNKRIMNKTQESTVSFNKAETDKILSGVELEKLGATTIAKLESLCLADSDVYPLLKRNLSLLFNK
jgi:epoxyqueuosine reductase